MQNMPELIGGRPMHIIGCGSLGAKLFLNLYRKGVENIHLWDADVVEARNRYNQPYFAEHVGALKVEALARIARMIYPESAPPIPHPENVTWGTKLDGLVFACVDRNTIRYGEVWPCVRLNDDVSFFADGRVGMDGGKAYGFDPANEWHAECYEEPGVEAPIHNHPDPEEIVPGCKTEFPMPENSDRVAAEMLWRLNRWLDLEQGSIDPYLNHIAWCYAPRYAEAHEYWDEDE